MDTDNDIEVKGLDALEISLRAEPTKHEEAGVDADPDVVAASGDAFLVV